MKSLAYSLAVAMCASVAMAQVTKGTRHRPHRAPLPPRLTSWRPQQLRSRLRRLPRSSQRQPRPAPQPALHHIHRRYRVGANALLRRQGPLYGQKLA